MASRRLPIFPLPIVLLPGTPQLLHIFEPRYVQMLSDCEAGDRAFGISFVRAHGVPDPAPEPGDVGCTAQLHTVQRLPDGRANVLTTGGERYVLRSYVQSDRLYRVGLVDPFEDDGLSEDGLDSLAAAVRRDFMQLAEKLAVMHDAVPPPAELPQDPTELSFRIAAALAIPPEAKQRFLTMRSPHTRLRHLRAILRELSDEVADKVDMHLRARRNGRRGRVPQTT